MGAPEIFVSSANIAMLLSSTASGRSFTYKRNWAGPRMDPCVTPEQTGNGSDVAPLTVTRCRWSVRYDLNQ